MWGALVALALAASLHLLTGPGRFAEADLAGYADEDHGTQFASFAALEPICCIEELHLANGQSLDVLFQNHGLAGDSRALIEALGELVNLRALRPEDCIRLFRRESGFLERLEYQRSLEEKVVVERGETAFSARLETEPVETQVRKIAGSIESSLYLAVVAAGGSPGLVLDFADLFSWDFDFLTDTRAGDRFEMLVEERSVRGTRIGFGRVLSGKFIPVDRAAPMEAFVFQWEDQGESEQGYYTRDGRSVKKFFLKSPLNYRRISSGFTYNRKHPILKTVRPHLGVDYAAPKGTHVVALGSGKVEWAGTKGGFGKTVIIRHNKTYRTQYAHLSGYGPGIRSGARVSQGQLIGYVGSTGLSTGPHLDFRVQENGKWINPLSLKGGASEPLAASRRPAFESWVQDLDALNQGLEAGGVVAWPPAPAEPPLTAAQLDTPASS